LLGEKDFTLIFTKTDYDRFQLRRYPFKINEIELTTSNIISFIEDIKMKRIE
jgi:hypothetical protein